ncbi:FAD binding domain-containing protein [Bisporella sp. PMI_857]|nr:FAD binding domain-containing protein [Bisporella sp. PMI_857]
MLELRNSNDDDDDDDNELLEVDNSVFDDPDVYSAIVTTEKDRKEEKFETKYILGSDGGHSAVRKLIGFNMIGYSSDLVWGVMDVFPQTNFPDIRKQVILQSDSGSVVLVSGEGGSIVRFYIGSTPLGSFSKGDNARRAKAAAQKIFGVTVGPG